MPMRIRFAMHGKRNHRILHLVAIDQRKARNAKPVEVLGVYDPRVRPGENHKEVAWSVDRIKYWLGVGALPSKSAVKLLEMGNVIPPNSKYHPKAVKPKNQMEASPEASETNRYSTSNHPPSDLQNTANSDSMS